jgi:trigger factor
MSTSFTISKIDTLPKSEAVITGTLSVEAIEKERKNAIQSFQDRLTLPGFRQGHIPEKILIDKVGELSIFEEAAINALQKNFPEIINEAKLEMIGQPKISITKIAIGSPVEFKIETAVMPKIKLPDYKKIAKESGATEDEIKEKSKADDKEIDEALQDMRRSLAHYEKHHQQDSVENDSSKDEHHDHSGKDIPEEELPPLDDEFAKKIGSFETFDALKGKIQESISNEKRIREKEKNRLQIIEKIVEESEIEVPGILIESEISKMMAELRSTIERMGMKYDEYLKNIKKTEDDFRTEWKSEAEKRSKIQLILNEIAAEEKLEADEEMMKKEIEAILSHHKDIKRENVESYVRNILLNEKVWLFLESQKS